MIPNMPRIPGFPDQDADAGPDSQVWYAPTPDSHGKKVKFADAHRPALLDGQYTVSVTHTVSVNGASHDLGAGQGQRDWTFEVAGPRFALAQALVRAVYPPRGDRGDHIGVIPHLVLTRATLPWERSADPSLTEGPPWLTIIAAGSEEQVITTRHPEISDAPAVRMLRIKAGKLPRKTNSLSLGAHVRLDDKGAPDGATVLGAHALTAGDWTLHLVSVEGQYTNGALQAPADKLIDLPSLFSWTVTVDEDDGRLLFQDLTKELNAGPLGVHRELPGGASTLTRGGAVAMPHGLNDGGSTVSWYRGPLLGDPEIRPDIMFDLPVRRADDLAVIDTDRSVIDVSYAAAWEYGRLMTLSRGRVARSLARWKRQRRRGQHAAHCCKGHEAAEFVEATGGAETPFPEKAYFRVDLGLLAAVPFGCLVPDPAALPPESIRAFDIDDCWVHCLQDGAFLTGRATEGDFSADCETCGTLCHCQGGACACTGPPAPERGLGGFLLRSRLVMDLPDLAIEAVAFGSGALTLRRMSSPAPGVLFAIYDGRPERVRLSLPAQKMHFQGAEDVELADMAGKGVTPAAFAVDKIAPPLSKVIPLQPRQKVYGTRAPKRDVLRKGGPKR